MKAALVRSGHTLVELMVVLAIAAVLLAAAAPSLQAFIARQRLRVAQNDLFAAINLTRSQAITRGTRVTLTPQDAAGADWTQGWLVFIDSNGNQRLDPAEERIFQQGPVDPGISIKFAFSSGPARQYITYNGDGRSCSAASSLAAHWGTLSLFQGTAIRRIKINMLGRVRACDPQLQPRSCSGAADAQ
jgi:type IV fimbrial biogenesis protein FimT